MRMPQAQPLCGAVGQRVRGVTARRETVRNSFRPLGVAFDPCVFAALLTEVTLTSHKQQSCLLQTHRSWLAACQINVAMQRWWRRTRTGNGSMSPSCEGDVGRAAAQQRRAETQWFAVHDGMSSGPWDNHSNSQWSTVLPSARTTLTEAHYVCGQYRTPRGRNGQHGRLPGCISGADPETICAYVAQRAQLTRAAALSAFQTLHHTSS